MSVFSILSHMSQCIVPCTREMDRRWFTGLNALIYLDTNPFTFLQPAKCGWPAETG